MPLERSESSHPHLAGVSSGHHSHRAAPLSIPELTLSLCTLTSGDSEDREGCTVASHLSPLQDKRRIRILVFP